MFYYYNSPFIFTSRIRQAEKFVNKNLLKECPVSYGRKHTLVLGGGLFTRSGSAADPFLVEPLPALANPKNNLSNAPRRFVE